MAEDRRKDIEELKLEYGKYQKKYGFPEYKELNEEFEIEKLVEVEGTELFTKMLRKVMMEKVFSLLRLLESFINPQNAPMFVLAILKNLKQGTGKIVERLYNEVCSLEIKALTLDIVSDEKKEVELIKEIIKKWKSVGKDNEELCKEVNRAWSASEKKEMKSYSG